MFFSKKMKKLKALSSYTPTTKQERLVVTAVQSVPVLCGMHEALGILRYKSDEWVFEVMDASTPGVRVWWVPDGEYILGAGNTLEVGTISDECFMFLLSDRYSSKTQEGRLKQLYKEWGIEY